MRLLLFLLLLTGCISSSNNNLDSTVLDSSLDTSNDIIESHKDYPISCNLLNECLFDYYPVVRCDNLDGCGRSCWMCSNFVSYDIMCNYSLEISCVWKCKFCPEIKE